MTIPDAEREQVRRLAAEFIEKLDLRERARRIEQWRAVNSLRAAPPPIYVRAFAWATLPESKLHCVHPVCRELEGYFRRQLFRMDFHDDYIFQPWYQSTPVYAETGWGLEPERVFAGVLDELESYKENYPLTTYAEMKKLILPRWRLDAAATDEKEAQLHALVGDLLPVEMYRGAWSWGWGGDISTAAGHLRGIENIMTDLYEEPAALAGLFDFLSRGVVAMTRAAEAAGELTLLCHFNQAMTYADDLPDPAFGVKNVKTTQLWNFTAAQEFALIGPEHHEEFLLRYQLPIMEMYGLVAYGCCEDLTRKIAMLRQIPNLRRIAVSPFAKVAACAEAIGRDYTISYRPNPALLASGYRRDAVKAQLAKDFDLLKDSFFDITLKDVETVEGDPRRVADFVADARTLIDRFFPN